MDIVTYAILRNRVKNLNSSHFAEEALASAEAAAQSATLAQSWTEGGTGTRDGENINNVSYYATQAAESASLAIIAAGQASNGANVDGTMLEFVEGDPGSSSGQGGNDGVTFTPSVSNAGVISWTNDGNMSNPSPVDLVSAVISALPSAVGVSF